MSSKPPAGVFHLTVTTPGGTANTLTKNADGSSPSFGAHFSPQILSSIDENKVQANMDTEDITHGNGVVNHDLVDDYSVFDEDIPISPPPNESVENGASNSTGNEGTDGKEMIVNDYSVFDEKNEPVSTKEDRGDSSKEATNEIAGEDEMKTDKKDDPAIQIEIQPDEIEKDPPENAPDG